LHGNKEWAEIKLTFSRHEPWLFVACGSSYYLSQTIAAQWTKLLRVRCEAVPASEMLFAAEEILQRTRAKQIVLVSRSGKTTEVLRVAECLNANPAVRTLGVTCSEESDLAKLCTRTLKMPWTDEQSMVMTRSFTAVLTLFTRLGAEFANDAQLAASLDALPEHAEAWLAANAGKMRAFAAKRVFSDYVFLGQGAHYWLAQEAALKMTEMSSSYAQAYHTLEFRHGPKAIASKDTLITLLLSDASAKEEIPLIGELKELRASVLVIANRVASETRKIADLIIELELDSPEFVRMAMTAIPAQLLGLEAGLCKGLNPDVPKNLARAVVLGAIGAASSQRSRD
jgi:glucosamine--fructose-6-phosphate aminotransferase (isomerizing)